ncbi:MAG TPA: hypothetical protein VK980_02245, partial [Sphingomonas sp.]|nr:hypothetical protein [Sphingomonas sp.]
MKSVASLRSPLLACSLIMTPLLAPAALARTAAVATHVEDASGDAANLTRYEHRAQLSKELGATQMNVTDDLPLAMWEVDADDPYPAWFVHHATLFKIFPPAAVQPFVDMGYARRLQAIVARRCGILQRNGLAGVWIANEPA